MLPATLAITLLRGSTPVSLRYKPSLRKTYRYHVTMDVTDTIQGIPPRKLNTKFALAFTTVSRANDVTTIEITCGKATVTVPPKSPLTGEAKKREQLLVGSTITTKLDSRLYPAGQVTRPDVSHEGAFNPAFQVLRFPSKSVNVGETWSSQMDMSTLSNDAKGSPFKGRLPILFKLESLSGNRGNISMSMKGSFREESPKGFRKTSLRSHASLTIDVRTGTTISSKAVTDLSGNRYVRHLVQTMQRSR